MNYINIYYELHLYCLLLSPSEASINVRFFFKRNVCDIRVSK